MRHRISYGRLSTAAVVAAAGATAALVLVAPASADTAHFSPEAPGVGDPYFPLEGNGGYDVGHYGLTLTYDPAAHQLAGVDTVTARATQNLSRSTWT